MTISTVKRSMKDGLSSLKKVYDEDRKLKEPDT